MSQSAITESERGGSARLWVGMLTGPGAWSLQILIGYNLEEIACRSGSTQRMIAGAGIETVIVSLTLSLIVLTMGAGVVAYDCLRRIRRAADYEADTGKSRALWMARVGIISSGIFAFMLGLGLLPALFFQVCDPPL
ncbi:MAG: hypothetical protein ACRDK3_12530 [Actinomycetota bacterium]